jgi:hypothetical protein
VMLHGLGESGRVVRSGWPALSLGLRTRETGA